MGGRSQTGKLILFALSLPVVCCGTAPAAAAAQDNPATFPVRVEHNVQVPMRDGVALAADIYFAGGPGPFPVLLDRTPYNKSRPSNIATATFFAIHGYVAVVMDSRGLYASHGEWRPYIDEGQDGYDTQQWIGHQPWCNGKIGMWGISYPGYTQLISAPFRSPYLKAIMPIGAQSDNFGSVWYSDGIFYLAFALQWATQEEAVHQNKRLPDVNWMELNTRLPIKDSLKSLGIHSPFLADVITHSTYDDFWKQMSLHDRYHEMDVPSFFVSGWFDELLHETFVNFTNLRKQSRSERSRRGQKLVIGPWPHGNTTRTSLEGVDFGSQSSVDLNALQLRWFDYQLRGIDNGMETEAPIRIFVMGANEWRDFQEWPPASVQPTRFYLHSDGFANSRFGHGALADNRPKDESADHYRYDPGNPVPSFGGHGCCAGEMAPFGPRDQRAIQGRLDVLVYSTKPISTDLQVVGTATVNLEFSTDVRDTDFFVILSDASPDGRSNLVTEGFLRARFRSSLEKPELLVPHKVYQVAIPLWETAYVFKANHRIQLQITSSNFPEFDRNLNTAKRFGQGTEADIRIADQTIYHDREHPSVLLLPVIPPAALNAR